MLSVNFLICYFSLSGQHSSAENLIDSFVHFYQYGLMDSCFTQGVLIFDIYCDNAVFLGFAPWNPLESSVYFNILCHLSISFLSGTVR